MLVERIHELLGSAVSSAAEFFAVLMCDRDLDVVFIDEIHLLDAAMFQRTLLLAVDERKIFLPTSNGGAPQAITLRTSR